VSQQLTANAPLIEDPHPMPLAYQETDGSTNAQTYRSRPTSAGEPHVVALVSPGWPKERFSNGIVTYTTNMRDALSRGGLRVFVIAMRIQDQAAIADDPDVIPLFPPVGSAEAPPARPLLHQLARKLAPEREREWWWSTAIVRAATRLQRESGLQLLQMEESFGWARSVIRRSPVPVVVRLHGPWFLNGVFENVGDRAFRRRVRKEGETIRKAAAVSAPSQDVLDRVRRYYDIRLPNAVVIPNPMSIPPEEDCWSLERCERDRIAFVGRFDRHKGGDLIIDAFGKVLQHRPKARLTFIGKDSGLVDSSGTEQTLKSYVEQRIPGSLEDGRIEWLGAQPHNQLNTWRRQAYVTVVPSRYETFGNTLREAMVIGCPVIASNVGGLAEVLKTEVNGLTFRDGDADDLARTLLRLLEDPALACRLGRQARQDCARLYAPEPIREQTLNFYRETLNRWHTAGKHGAKSE